MPMIVPPTKPSPSKANSFTIELTPTMRMITAINTKQPAWANMIFSDFFNVSGRILANDFFPEKCVLLQP